MIEHLQFSLERDHIAMKRLNRFTSKCFLKLVFQVFGLEYVLFFWCNFSIILNITENEI